jgi:hypothetical protein
MTVPTGARADGITNDGPAINAWLAGGGTRDLTGGPYLFDGPLRFEPGTRLSIKARLLYRQGWASAYALCSRPFFEGNRTLATGDVVIDMTGGSIELLPGSTQPRKGIGITFCDGVRVIKPTVKGVYQAPAGINLFAMEVRSSRNGTITGGFLNVISGQQGADGIHFTGDCYDWLIDGLAIVSGDDAFGFTNEVSAGVIERITVRNCLAETKAHSAVKLLLIAGGRLANIVFENNDLKTTLSPGGQGAPIIIDQQYGVISGVALKGGRLRVVAPPAGLVGGPLVRVNRASNVSIAPAEIAYFSRSLLVANRCIGLSFKPGKISALGVIPQPSVPTPLVSVAECPNAILVLPSGSTPAYPGQQMISRT